MTSHTHGMGTEDTKSVECGIRIVYRLTQMRLTMSKKLRRLGNQTRGKDGSARDGTVDVALNVTTSPYKSPLLLSMHRNGACPVTQ